MISRLTARQQQVLNYIAQRGTVNGYAGQPGFDPRSARSLVRLGLVAEVPSCENCRNDVEGCLAPIGDQSCYNKLEITELGILTNNMR